MAGTTFWDRHPQRCLTLMQTAVGRNGDGMEIAYATQSTTSAIALLKTTYPLRADEFYATMGDALLTILEEEAV